MIDRDGRQLIFLLGVPRSGTTLLSHLLDSHPQIASPPEPWLMLAVDAIGVVHPLHPAGSQLIGQGYRDLADGLDIRSARAAFAVHLYNQYLQRHNKSCFVDKTPRYYQILDEIGRIFPQAKFIYIKRHPFAVTASLKSSWNFDLGQALVSGDDELLFDLVLGYRWLERFARDQAHRVHSCGYDELVRDPNGTLAAVWTFLAVPPMDAAMAFASERLDRRRFHLGDQKILTTRTVHQDSLSIWQEVLTADEKQAVRDLFNADELQALCPPELLEQLGSSGIHDNGSAIAQETLARIEAQFRARRRTMESTARETPQGATVVAAMRKAAKQPDEAIRLLGVGESALALIERQAALLARLEAERAGHLARIDELVQLVARLRQDQDADQDLVQKVQLLLEEREAERDARQRLEQLVNQVLDRLQAAEGPLVRLRRLFKD